MFEAPFYIQRKPLARWNAAIAAKDVTLGFIGGSITDQRSREHWAEKTLYELCAAHPDVSFHIVNAAVGATNSLHALFRAEQDLIGRGCDVIFIEFAVNDLTMLSVQRRRVREGLVRKLLHENCDLVFVYTYERSMLDDLMANRLPESVAEFEAIAAHYGIPGVFMANYALDCVKKGRLRYEEWLPDGLHPGHCGSRFYAEPVLALLNAGLQSDAMECILQDSALPPPLLASNYETARILPFDSIRRKGYWFEQQPLTLPLVFKTLSSFAPGSSLDFAFEGSGFVIMIDFGNFAADFRFRIDGGEWQSSNIPQEAWIQAGWGVMRYTAVEDLARGTHRVELEVCLNQNSDTMGCNLDICYIGILP